MAAVHSSKAGHKRRADGANLSGTSAKQRLRVTDTAADCGRVISMGRPVSTSPVLAPPAGHTRSSPATLCENRKNRTAASWKRDEDTAVLLLACMQKEVCDPPLIDYHYFLSVKANPALDH